MTLGEFLRIIRKYHIKTRVSDEDLVNDLLLCVIEPGKVKKRNRKETLYIERSYANKIINNRASVPPSIVEALSREGILKYIREKFEFYCKDFINESKMKLLLKEMGDLEDDFEPSRSNYTNLDLLFKVFISTLYVENNLECKSEFLIKKTGESYLRVVVGDIFKYGFSTRKQRKNIVVIPVNTSFNTHISTKLESEQYPMVSTQTIHGSWLLRLKNRQEKIENIDNRIKKNLSKQGITSDINKKYPIGSIATIDFGNACFYLLAVSDFDNHNHASSNKEFIRSAIDSLIKHYDSNGQGYDIFIPLLGTGLSRANLGYQESYNLIVEAVLNREIPLCGKVNIVIPNEIINEIEIGGK